MADMKTRKAGRPRKPVDEVGENYTFRMPKPMREKLERIGGAPWLRDRIKLAREAKG